MSQSWIRQRNIDAFNFIEFNQEKGITAEELFHGTDFDSLASTRNWLCRWMKKGYLNFIPGKPSHMEGVGRPVGHYYPGKLWWGEVYLNKGERESRQAQLRTTGVKVERELG